MRRDSLPLEWIDKLSTEEVTQHLIDRNLQITGILPVLRARLRRYEEASLQGTRLRPTFSPGAEAGEPVGSAEMVPSGTGESTPTRESLFLGAGLLRTPPPHKTWEREPDVRDRDKREQISHAFVRNDTVPPFDPRLGASARDDRTRACEDRSAYGRQRHSSTAEAYN